MPAVANIMVTPPIEWPLITSGTPPLVGMRAGVTAASTGMLAASRLAAGSTGAIMMIMTMAAIMITSAIMQ